MAKRKRSAPKEAPKAAPEPESNDNVIDGEVIDEACKQAESAGRDLFSKIGDTFRAAGSTAATYGRVGLKMAEMEKLRLELRLNYAKLGEAVMRCWDAAPDIGVAPGDGAVKAQAKAVQDLRRRIRETEIKIRELQK